MTNAVKLYKEVLHYDNTHVEAIACIATHHFYTDQPEIALRFYRWVYSFLIHFHISLWWISKPFAILSTKIAYSWAIEPGKVALTFVSFDEVLYGVGSQIKSLWQYFKIVLFVFRHFTKWNVNFLCDFDYGHFLEWKSDFNKLRARLSKSPFCKVHCLFL